MTTVGILDSQSDLIRRVLRYRRSGFIVDGIHTLQGFQIDDVDYSLMGADNSCSEINHPEIGQDSDEKGFRQLLWFAIKKGTEISKRSFGNSHGSSDDGGKTYYTETAMLDIPKRQYQSSPEEVVWHHLRVNELRKKGVKQPERVYIMSKERKSKPWARAR
jgi:hypothetical protein